jgi:RNA recognition motif-containing protein
LRRSSDMHEEGTGRARSRERDRHRRGDRPSRFQDRSPSGDRDRPARRGAPMERRVYISNIPYEYRWQDLKDLFRAEGL